MKPSPDSAPPIPLQPHVEHAAAPDIADLRPDGELLQYFCFAIVAQELHFTRGSHRVRIDQSAVSRHIQKLESVLGVKLFVRGERRVELTDAGEALFPFARKALIACKAGERLAQAIARGEPQEFEVGYSTLVDTHLIAQVKALAESARPHVPVRLRSAAPEKLVSNLFNGTSHAVITLLPVEEEVGVACLLREDLFAVVPVSHRLAQRSPIRLGEFGDDPVIWPSGAMPPTFTQDLFSRFRRAGYIPNITHQAQSVAESLGFTREGQGITFVKTSDRPLAYDGLAVLSLVPPFPVETGLVHLKERRWPFLKDFIDLIASHFRLEGPASAAPSEGA